MNEVSQKVNVLENYMNSSKTLSKFNINLVRFVEASYEIRKLINDMDNELLRAISTDRFPVGFFDAKKILHNMVMINKELGTKQLKLENKNLFDIQTLIGLQNGSLIFYSFLPCVRQGHDEVQIVEFNQKITLVHKDSMRIFELKQNIKSLRRKTQQGHMLYAELDSMQEWKLRQKKKVNLIWKTTEDACSASLVAKDNKIIKKYSPFKEIYEDIVLETLNKGTYVIHARSDEIGKIICEYHSYGLIIGRGSTKIKVEEN